MALRAVLMSKGALSRQWVRSLLAQPNVLAVRVMPVKQASSLKPAQNYDRPSMFSWQSLKKSWEISPILVILSVTLVCQVMWIVRTAMTRDDVRYGSNQSMLCEERDLDKEAPPVRKFRVYNQKYVVSPELYDALQALKPPTAEEQQQQQKSK